MAKILFNIPEHETTVINNIPIIKVFKSVLNENKALFTDENFEIFQIDDSYKFRPDKVAYEVYRNDYFYPLILYANNISSILQFTPDIIGTEIKYLKPEIVSKLHFNF